MGGHGTGPDSPFDGRVRKAQAVFSGGEFLYFLAVLALLNNGMAATSIKLTPLFVHKEAFETLFYTCTNHGYHILSLKYYELKKRLYALSDLDCQAKTVIIIGGMST